MYQQWYYIDIQCFRCSLETKAINPNIGFFGRQPHFELNIVDSKFVKFWKPQAWLGGSIMDFVNFSHYFSSPPDIWKAIFVPSALITPSLKKLCFGIKGGTRVIELEAIMVWQVSPIIGWKWNYIWHYGNTLSWQDTLEFACVGTFPHLSFWF